MIRSIVAAGLVSLFAAVAAGQSVQPSNDTLSSDQTQAVTQLSLDNAPLPPGQQVYNLAPLTARVGLGQNANSVALIKFPGTLTLFNATNENQVNSNDIAYISCDPTSEGGFLNSTSVVHTVGNAMPQAIVLYSLDSVSCNLTGSFTFTTIYTMISAQDSNLLYNSLLQNSTFNAVIGLNSTSNGTDNNPDGPAPTTAVAMSILYSITGVITLLFLIVIASGAIRAHRNPERYGPRAGITGRPRQSRAKGLARAMLETLPIVKFGDPVPAKPGERDIELEDGTSSVHENPEATGAAATVENETEQTNSSAAEGAEASPESNATAVAGEGTAEPVPKAQDDLGCSICTEDFHTGEDVRVLPCDHKYHPACIDPWLLNVSGTCPLCRHDLQPAPTATVEGAEGAEVAEGGELPPPLSPSEGTYGEIAATDGGETTAEASHHHRLRVSRLLDLTRLRTAPPEERIAALRQLREQSQREGDAEGAQPSRQAGLTSRLRDKFRIRTRRHPAAQE